MSVHRLALIDDTRGEVLIDDTAEVMAYAVVVGPAIIEDGARIFPTAVVGCEGEHASRGSDWNRRVVVGASAVIREGAVVQRGVVDGLGTVVLSGAYVMHGAHVAHDCLVGVGAKMAPGACLGGWSRVLSGGYLGIHASTHPGVVVGQGSIVGMGGVVTKHVPPGRMWVGVPARDVGENVRGRREGVDAEAEMDAFLQHVKLVEAFYKKG